jgi:dolichyl-phosphate-mannose--protein O-mannosyl transferase
LHPDESDYLRKAMHVVAGLGPQEGMSDPIAINNQPYTHPHFGQLFLAEVLGVEFSDPNLAVPAASSLAHTIELLYSLPRLVMGLLAVLDTFFIFMIAKRKYDRSIAFVSSTLFAVMPIDLDPKRSLLG